MNFHQMIDREHIIFKADSKYKQSWETLLPNFYTLTDIGNMFEGAIPCFMPVKEKDKLINFTSGVIGEVLADVEDFFSEKVSKKYSYLNLTHKMGLILFGPHGTGKTCTNHLIMKQMVEKYQAICLDCTTVSLSFVKEIIAMLRKFQNNPIVIFMDEFEGDANRSDFLPFLDGNDSVNKLLFIGCTNHLEKIPERIRNRKSRIKYCYEIKSLPLAVYQDYISQKLPDLKPAIVAEFAYKAEEAKLTIDQLKHAVIDYYIEGITLDEAIKEAKDIVEIASA